MRRVIFHVETQPGSEPEPEPEFEPEPRIVLIDLNVKTEHELCRNNMETNKCV